MIQNVVQPFIEGFQGSLKLSKGILLALLSVVTVVVAFVNTPRVADFDPTRRLP
ncbi:hypothetical protein [Peristeroidobacter soli]|jgi:hypothetical protein|uniref:hypothetical protein n=1 Tax=Peristeroidobacter soli TaxID=2497877 RepID=UPI0013006B0F|nr:hypothetical protein [Peristeroidobacter soli]